MRRFRSRFVFALSMMMGMFLPGCSSRTQSQEVPESVAPEAGGAEFLQSPATK